LANAVEYGALYLSCVAAAAGFLSYRTLMSERVQRSRVEASAAQERLRALRSQLNPHFLFNVLNSIASLCVAQPHCARRLITLLSELLQRTLRASEEDAHALSQELAYVDAYFRIQEVRRPTRIRWRMSVDETCETALTPSLLLLPLAENAVTHGLRGGAPSVDIELDAACRGDVLVIALRNTCRPSMRSGRRGLGLRNVRERLDVMFGSQATLSARRTAPDRFEAVIRLPLTRHDESLCDCEDPVCEF
jgi:two-component system LytT family sensor kinase